MFEMSNEEISKKNPFCFLQIFSSPRRYDQQLYSAPKKSPQNYHNNPYRIPSQNAYQRRVCKVATRVHRMSHSIYSD